MEMETIVSELFTGIWAHDCGQINCWKLSCYFPKKKKTDLCYISEANLWDGLLPHEREIQGHIIILPYTMESMGHACIVLLIRNDLSYHKLEQHMDSETATIWVRVG